MNFCCVSAPAGINGIQHNLSSKVTPEWFANSSVFYLLMSSCVSLTSVCPHCALRTMKGLFNQTHFKAFKRLMLWLLLFSWCISAQVNILIWEKKKSQKVTAGAPHPHGIIDFHCKNAMIIRLRHTGEQDISNSGENIFLLSWKWEGAFDISCFYWKYSKANKRIVSVCPCVCVF